LVQTIQMLMYKFTNKQENLELELLISEEATKQVEPQEMNLMITPRKNDTIN